MTKPITSKRWKRKDYYRAQVNVDKRVWAFMYNAVVKYAGKKAAENMRNALRESIEKVVKQAFYNQAHSKVGNFKKNLREFLNEEHDPEFPAKMREFWLENEVDVAA